MRQQKTFGQSLSSDDFYPRKVGAICPCKSAKSIHIHVFLYPSLAIPIKRKQGILSDAGPMEDDLKCHKLDLADSRRFAAAAEAFIKILDTSLW